MRDIYLMVSNELDFGFKIGLSKNVDNRKKQLNTQSTTGLIRR